MVWIKEFSILIFFLFFFSKNLFSSELTDDERMYFNFIDLNNDNKITQLEIEKSIKVIFQLVDLDEDGFISIIEVNELKNIINVLR